jgi:hypothetical protein
MKKHSQESESMKAIKGLPVSDKFYIQNIQSRINQFPWKEFDKQSPNIQVTQKIDPPTQKALGELRAIGELIKNKTLLGSLDNIEQGKLREGASLLFDSIQEIQKLMRQNEKYIQHTGGKRWTLQEKVEYIKATRFPVYFPRPWQPANVGRRVSGGAAHGEVCGPWQPEGQFRTCETPYYNHFLMWGPDCPGCGVNATDPRRSLIKRKYPEVFTYEKIRERMKNHIWSPVLPSPGVAPYVVAPPEGTPYYKNPHDPHPEVEGVRFFDAQDERLYREFERAYAEFKKAEASKAETLAYNQKFFDRYPHKQVAARAKAPNEWSSTFYGREKPLWPDGTERPSAEVLKQRIQEIKNKAANGIYDDILKLSKNFEDIT